MEPGDIPLHPEPQPQMYRAEIKNFFFRPAAVYVDQEPGPTILEPIIEIKIYRDLLEQDNDVLNKLKMEDADSDGDRSGTPANTPGGDSEVARDKSLQDLLVEMIEGDKVVGEAAKRTKKNIGSMKNKNMVKKNEASAKKNASCKQKKAGAKKTDAGSKNKVVESASDESGACSSSQLSRVEPGSYWNLQPDAPRRPRVVRSPDDSDCDGNPPSLLKATRKKSKNRKMPLPLPILRKDMLCHICGTALRTDGQVKSNRMAFRNHMLLHQMGFTPSIQLGESGGFAKRSTAGLSKQRGGLGGSC